MSIADSGALSHFVTTNAPLVNKTIAKQPLAITTAGGAVIYPSHTGELDLPYLPISARCCHVVPSLGKFSLLSIGQLCNADCDVTFSKEKLTDNFGNTVIIQGQRVRSTGLWHIDLVNHDRPQDCATVPMSAVVSTKKKRKGTTVQIPLQYLSTEHQTILVSNLPPALRQSVRQDRQMW
jgi:hypothetical protein